MAGSSPLLNQAMFSPVIKFTPILPMLMKCLLEISVQINYQHIRKG